MNRLRSFLLASAALTALAATSALAASSGNFTAEVDNFNCTINSANGTFNSGPVLVNAGEVWEIGNKNDITVQIANGAGTTLVVTPSLVTGLFTDNKINTSFPVSTQDVGIQVQVTVTPTNGTVVAPGAIKIAPATPGDSMNNTDKGATCMVPAGSPTGTVTSCVIYDQRFIQISSNVLANLLQCVVTTIFGGTCFELVESTLSAHAFNFYVQAPGGSYKFDVDAQLFVGKNNTLGAGSVAACAGPGTVTVVQTKNFSFDTPIGF